MQLAPLPHDAPYFPSGTLKSNVERMHVGVVTQAGLGQAESS
jgi:hypothetical protein